MRILNFVHNCTSTQKSYVSNILRKRLLGKELLDPYRAPEITESIRHSDAMLRNNITEIKEEGHTKT